MLVEPVVKTAISLSVKIIDFICTLLEPVANMPAWKPFMTPGPDIMMLSLLGTTIPTLELCCPGPVIV